MSELNLEDPKSWTAKEKLQFELKATQDEIEHLRKRNSELTKCIRELQKMRDALQIAVKTLENEE